MRILVALMFLLCSVRGMAQELTPFDKALARDGSQGQDFWIAIPPNEREAWPTNELAIQIASAYDADVTVEGPGGYNRKHKVKANTVLNLSTLSGSANWSWEIWEAAQVVPKGIHITSTQPVTVSVMNCKQTTSDGYLAIPVAFWGTRYVACSYYDFNEVGVHPWGGGFVVAAAENGTVVNITLKGTGGNLAKTTDGRRIGDTFTVTLDAGDVYRVRGDATTRGVFDLTGSSVTSNKPVGMYSYHERTTMPNLLVNGNGRNNLVEMNRPVAQWDTMYVTREFNREHRGTGRGDVFRVVAAEDNTLWTVKYYETATMAQIGSDGGVLAKAGDFADRMQASAPAALINGYSVWTANKPIQVVQYSCSQSWDNDPDLDPFSIDLVPEPRFITASMFQVSMSSKFSLFYLNLIVQTDPASTNVEADLKSLEINGVPVWNHRDAIPPTMLDAGKIPGTSCYSASIRLSSAGAYRITSNGNVRFSGYHYGYGAADAYGLPLGATNAYTSDKDTTAPDIASDTSGIRGIDVNVADTVSVRIPVATGICRVGFVGTPVNARIADVSYKLAHGNAYHGMATATVEAIDPAKPMQARVVALDNSGNASYTNIQRQPVTTIAAEKSAVDMGTSRKGVMLYGSVTIINSSDVPRNIRALRFVANNGFSIAAVSYPIRIDGHATRTFPVRYLADTIGPRQDTLIVETDVNMITVALTATHTYPVAAVTNVSFRPTVPGEQRYSVLRVANDGNDDLVITAIDGLAAPFTVTEPTGGWPVTLKPKQVLALNVGYAPLVAGKDSIMVRLVTTGTDGDTTATLVGTADIGAGVSAGDSPSEAPLVTPLPAHDVFAVTAPESYGAIRTITIRDLRGILQLMQEFKDAPSGNVSVSCAGLAPGAYIVEVRCTNGTLNTTLVVQR